MFETAVLGRSLAKADYDAQVADLRTQLLRAQHELAQADFPVLVLLEGIEGAGKGKTLNLLHAWLDTRYLATHAYTTRTREERQRPEYWRYWRDQPAAGRIAIFVGSWYTRPLRQRAQGKINESELESALVQIRSFEKTLTDHGALLVKLWFHLSKEDQGKQFRRLQAEEETSWRVSKDDWKQHRRYDSVVRVASRILRETSTGEAPWTLVEGTDERYRHATVARHLAERIRTRLEAPPVEVTQLPPSVPDENPVTILDRLDLARAVEKDEYEAQLQLLQGRLNRLSRRVAKRKLSVTLVFEGPDAAGKGGAIRRVTQALDARRYRVIPVAAPTSEEKSYHYLWRFWRHLPSLGRFTIYDRSWYGRVLVERVEGFASPGEWGRAYKEITDFERQLVDHGIVLCKFWLQISEEEQLRRFREREEKPWKQYKITPEDYRNRAKTNLYELAANDMIGRTSTEYAPWTLVEAEQKRFARLKVLQAICERIERQL